jgi:hypothetical protein
MKNKRKISGTGNPVSRRGLEIIGYDRLTDGKIED